MVVELVKEEEYMEDRSIWRTVPNGGGLRSALARFGDLEVADSNSSGYARLPYKCQVNCEVCGVSFNFRWKSATTASI